MLVSLPPGKQRGKYLRGKPHRPRLVGLPVLRWYPSRISLPCDWGTPYRHCTLFTSLLLYTSYTIRRFRFWLPFQSVSTATVTWEHKQGREADPAHLLHPLHQRSLHQLTATRTLPGRTSALYLCTRGWASLSHHCVIIREEGGGSLPEGGGLGVDSRQLDSISPEVTYTSHLNRVFFAPCLTLWCEVRCDSWGSFLYPPPLRPWRRLDGVCGGGLSWNLGPGLSINPPQS